MLVKKAISSVVVTSLLLVVVVLAVVGFQSWFYTFFSSLFIDVEVKSSLDSMVKVVGVINDKLYLYSDEDSIVDYLKIVDVDGKEMCSFENNIDRFGFETRLLLSFDDGTADDLSGYGYDGVIYGATYLEDDCVSGGCFKFDGVDDEMIFNHPNISKELTISAWVKIDSYYPRPSIIGQTLTYSLFVGNEGQLYTWLSTDEGWHRGGMTDPFTVVKDEWQYLVVTYSLNDLKYYLNGELIYENINDQTTGLLKKYDFDLVIGNENANYYNGSIDEVAIYSKVLSAEEIKILYDGRKARLYEQILSVGVNELDISFCNLSKSKSYDLISFIGNKKLEQKVIIR